MRCSLVPNRLEPVRLALTAVKDARGRGPWEPTSAFRVQAPEVLFVVISAKESDERARSA